MLLQRTTPIDRIRRHRITRVLVEICAGVAAGSQIAHGSRPAATSSARRRDRRDA